MDSGIMLDLGCGVAKKDGFVGMDKRAVAGVDIVHDMEVFPYPIPDGACTTIRAHHVLEHVKPWLTVDIFNELWRIMAVGGFLVAGVPYAGTHNFWQDPTHCNGFIELTFWYFDPRHSMYEIYHPKPWSISEGYPIKKCDGNMDVVMMKVEEK